MYIGDLKRKLRKLKKLEITIRFKNIKLTGRENLVWNKFFSTKDKYDKWVKYPINQLINMDHERLKETFDEYFYYVYFQKYKENGLNFNDMYDPTLLSLLGLSPAASINDIKKRYRELAKKYHPDCGGDSDKFIKLVEIYEKLLDD